MKKFYVFLVFVLLFALAGCKKNVLYQSDSGKTLTYAVGDEFSIKVPENPTTGYSWRFRTKPKSQMVISQISDRFEEPKNSSLGAGGEHIFVWQAVNAGEAEILGFHMRPWAHSKEEPSVVYKIIVR